MQAERQRVSWYRNVQFLNNSLLSLCLCCSFGKLLQNKSLGGNLYSKNYGLRTPKDGVRVDWQTHRNSLLCEFYK